eukprot:CAMPEP_0201739048 /NCGR_PEP_ID=MMETSP0593-20130828/45573_1 /ASSEMBLY_ACC=CAM_ASM_000672 /TAXON_ID=267983 /ORGANISM="Skeletonema japonicum, Strain CCMP2506" /LENGTH=48 /DNA_ID= /DNA_START= /DNA_END= /DNA_ORIENTATION=
MSSQQQLSIKQQHSSVGDGRVDSITKKSSNGAAAKDTEDVASRSKEAK